MKEFMLLWHCHFVFLAASCILFYPVFGPGYIFLLDWGGVTPFPEFSFDWSKSTLGWGIYDLLVQILSVSITQKIAAIGAVYYLGVGGFRLVKEVGNVYVRYFSGFLMMLNPFVYDRLADWQIGVVVASALLTWFVVFVFEYAQDDAGGKVWLGSVCAALAVSLMPHAVFFIAVFLGVFLCMNVACRTQSSLWRMYAGVCIMVLFLNANWIVGSSLGLARENIGLGDFSSADAEVFRTRGIDDGSVWWSAVSLHGYWGEYQDRFLLTQDNPVWPIFFIFIAALSVYGAIGLWRKRKMQGMVLAALFPVALVLGVGIASPATAWVTELLYAHMPLYIGFREPQKWIFFLVLAYAYFGAFGAASLLDEIEWDSRRKKVAGWMLMLLPLGYSWFAILGIWRAYVPRDFPKEWYVVRDMLNREDLSSGCVLVLPWHLYLQVPFAGGNVANPSRPFFGSRIVSGNNMEAGDTYSHAKDEQTMLIEKYVPQKSVGANIDTGSFIDDMHDLGIRLIMVMKVEDWEKYRWLDAIPGLMKIEENSQLILYGAL